MQQRKIYEILWLDRERGIFLLSVGEQWKKVFLLLYRPPAKRARDAKSQGDSGKIKGVRRMQLHFMVE